MSDEEKSQNAKNGFGIKTNTIITGLFGLLITGIGVVNHLQLNVSHDDTMAAVKDLKLEVMSGYVSKVDFQDAVTSLHSVDTKLWDKVITLADDQNKLTGDINMKLQHIEDSMPKK